MMHVHAQTEPEGRDKQSGIQFAAAQSSGSVWVGLLAGRTGLSGRDGGVGEAGGESCLGVGPGEHQIHSLKSQWLLGWLLCQ